MKCCSRSTLGVVVGIINVICNIGLIIYLIILLTNINTLNARRSNEQRQQQQRESDFKPAALAVFVIVICAIMAIISIIFIVGIVKRRHKLMLPWLILSGFGFVYNAGSFIVSFFQAIIYAAPLSTILTALFIGLFAFGLTALILWAIFNLYRDIRQNNIKSPLTVSAANWECNLKT